jgi:hypothetical protein
MPSSVDGVASADRVSADRVSADRVSADGVAPADETVPAGGVALAGGS